LAEVLSIFKKIMDATLMGLKDINACLFGWHFNFLRYD
jgi:hypothetical protein